MGAASVKEELVDSNKNKRTRMAAGWLKEKPWKLSWTKQMDCCRVIYEATKQNQPMRNLNELLKRLFASSRSRNIQCISFHHMEAETQHIQYEGKKFCSDQVNKSQEVILKSHDHSSFLQR